MKILLTICLLIVSCICRGQTYVHDPALDTIGGAVANVDASINGYFQQNGQWLTISNVNDAGLKTHTNTVSMLGLAIGVATNRLSSESSNITPLVNFVYSITNFGQSGSNYYSGSVSNNPGIISLGTFNGNSYTADLTMKSSFMIVFAPLMATMRGVLMGIIWFMFFKWSMEAVMDQMLKGINQIQTESPKQSFLGNNLSIVLGPILSAVITALLAAVAGALVAKGFTYNAYQSSQAAVAFMGPTGGPAIASWDVMTAMVPIPDIFAAAINWVAFRYGYMSPLFYAVRAVIRWLGL